MTSATSVLVVEDESIVALDISTRLEKLQYQVVGIAATGKAALSQAREFKPDVILMDIQIRGDLDGIETAAQIHAEFDIPVIYVTAYADESTLQRARITTPYGYLLKPFEERELHSTIAMALYKHEMEQRLKESEHWLDTTLHSIGDAVIATDGQGGIKLMNRVAEELTEWTESEARGQSIDTVFKVFDDDTDRPVPSLVNELLQNRDCQGLGPMDQHLVSRSGRKMIISNRAATIKNRRNLSGIVLAFRDVTAEREAQAQLRQQEKQAAVGRLAAGIAHEFNNILTGIIGYSELARNHPKLGDTTKHNLTQVINQGQRAAHLIRQILDFSRKSPIKKQLLDPVSFLTGTINLLSKTVVSDINVNIETNPRAGKYRMFADPDQIQQAVHNIAMNALESMPNGGSLTFKLEIVRDDTSSPETDTSDWIKITISDTGAGVSPQNIPHLFEPFFTTKQVGEGTGLGLAQAYGIVERHGGNINIDSTEQIGTTVTIKLPVTPAAPTTDPVQIKTTPVQGQGETILLLEDEANGVLQVVCSTLEFLGYHVLPTNSYRQAEQLYREHASEISLIITDIGIPSLNGQRLLQLPPPKNSKLKYLLFTDYLPDRHAAFPKKPGATVTFLQKPWRLEHLAQAVKDTINAA